MFKLLNRFAWIVSILFGFMILFLLGVLFDEMDGKYSSFLDDDFFFVWIILSLLIGMMFKKIFLSKSFVEQRVRFFADGLLKLEKPKKEKIKAQIEPVEKTKIEKEDTGYKNFSKEIKKEELVEKKSPGAIAKFFSQNLLAKLGSILVFLGVAFFLSLVYSVVGPVAKMIIGFALGFSLFGVGVWLDKKGIKNESKILIGVSILINYLVILGGRYLLGDDGYLSETLTFLFLVLNTVFAVLTSFIYKSQALLIFSFIFAYLNPLLIGANSDNPYTLLGYTLIVSLGTFFISYSHKNIILLVLSFLLGIFLILLAPINTSLHFTFVLLSLSIFNLGAISSSIGFRDKHKYILEFIFGGSFFAIASFGLISHINLVQNLEFLIMGICSIIFLIFSYILSKKATYLYSIGTAGTILLLTLIHPTNLFEASLFIEKIYILFIGIFAFLNWIVPFASKGFINPDNKKSITNLFIGSIFGAIFLGVNIYVFGEKYFPGLLQGMAFLMLAIIYFIQSFLFIQRIGIENVKSNENLENIFYNFAGISISLFSISIAFIFSKYPEIISTLWLFESTLLFYFFSKTKSFKIYLVAIVLFIIGIFKLGLLIDVVNSGDFWFLVSFIIIFISLVLNIKFLSPREKTKICDDSYEIIHCVPHIISIGVLSSLMFVIIPIIGNGWYIFSISIFIALLSFIYSYFSSISLKGFFIFLVACFLIFQIIELDGVFWKLERDNLEYLKILQYLSTFLVFLALFIWKKFNKSKFGNTVFSIIVSIYLLIITSFYVYDIFNNTFTVTIYWGLLSSCFLFYGIGKDLIKYRTLGLYLVSLTALKIFLYDIWFGIDDAIMRVVALMLIGILFIIVSTRYTRRFGNNMGHEFSLKNLSKDTQIKK